MSLRVAIQMDPLEHVNIDGDTTFALAETAQARGMEIFVYQPHDMSLEGKRVTARVRPAKVQRVPGRRASSARPSHSILRRTSTLS